MTELNLLPIEKYTTSTSIIDNDCITEGHGIRKDEIPQEAIDYLNTKMASRKLYKPKRMRIRVIALGVNKGLLPRKVI
jgi:hypothetical protein